MKTIAEQLREAQKRLGLSIADLNQRAAMFGIVCDRTTLGKKLAGTCPLATDYAELLANLLGTTIVWVPQAPRQLIRKKPEKRSRKATSKSRAA